MLATYLPAFILGSITLAFGLLILVLTFVIGPRRETPVKSSVYESGVVPIGPARQRMSVRYYLTATLFILFDIEVIYLYPWAVRFRQLARPGPEGLGWSVVGSMVVFLGILALGFVYVWRKGALEWGLPSGGEEAPA